MFLTLKLKITPTPSAKAKLWEASRRCTELWNACLEQRKDTKSWGTVNAFSQKKELPELKKQCPEFKLPSSQVMQNVVFDLDASYKMFFTKRKQGDQDVRPPRFKSSLFFYTQEYSQPNTSFLIADGLLKLAFGKNPRDWIEIGLALPSNIMLGKIKTLKIGFDLVSKYWFVCLSHSIKELDQKINGHTILFDPGCKTALTGIKTDGTFWEYDISPLRKVNIDTYKFIDTLKSKLDLMKEKASKAAQRLRKRIKKLFRKINTRTKTYLHANRLLTLYSTMQFYAKTSKSSLVLK